MDFNNLLYTFAKQRAYFNCFFQHHSSFTTLYASIWRICAFRDFYSGKKLSTIIFASDLNVGLSTFLINMSTFWFF